MQLLPSRINQTNRKFLQRHNATSKENGKECTAWVINSTYQVPTHLGRAVSLGESHRRYISNSYTSTTVEREKRRQFRHQAACRYDLLPVFDGFRCWRSMNLFNCLFSSRSESFSGLSLMHPATGHLRTRTEQDGAW